MELFASTSDDVRQVFFVLDSGDYSHTTHSYYAWVLPEQITWFKEVAEQYKHGDFVKRHLIFQHIPITEYWLASRNIITGYFNEDFAMNLGWTDEQSEERVKNLPIKNGVFSPEVNSGFFFQMLQVEEIWGMFVGHDHDNNFDGVYKDIHLVYGQSSGYNTYGVEPKGVRVIDLDEKEKTIETYPVFY